MLITDMPSPLRQVTLAPSWEEDARFRMHPGVVTSLLREQVPVLDFVDWRVTSIAPGTVHSVLPLNVASTNQHITHQAALFVLACDYTGGTALASLLPGWPVVGVHPICDDRSMALWLLKVDIKYSRPSVGDLTVVADLDDEARVRVPRRFLAGRAVIEPVTLRCFNGSSLVAEATLTYYARQSAALSADPTRVHPLYALKLASSAELIAGIRARHDGRVFDDPAAAAMAGPHGLALADRFCERTPQLAPIVAARTRHLDDALMAFVSRGGRQVVTVGVGLDTRVVRLPWPAGMTCVDVDFPATLAERRSRMARHGLTPRPDMTRRDVPLDLRRDRLAPAVVPHLDLARPVFVVWEGVTMYLDAPDVAAVLDDVGALLDHDDSRVWLDVARRGPVEAPEAYGDSIRGFMHGMRLLGEPFVFGADDLGALLAPAGLEPLEVTESNYLSGDRDDIYWAYRFCLAASGPRSR